MQIQAKAGHVAWDLGSYSFLDSDEEFDSIHPSLQRQSKLNQISFGLYEVVPGIYQVRGFDLSNVTFVEGETGWIVFDPAMSQEPATAALELINEHLGSAPCRRLFIEDMEFHDEPDNSRQRGEIRS